MSIQEELEEELENSHEHLTKSQIRKLKRIERKNKSKTNKSTYNNNLNLRTILPMTENQRRAFDSYRANKNLLLHGLPGTGKTFISLYLSLEEVLAQDNYNKIFIVRSIVPSRDIGFLPGNLSQKIDVYEAPYKSICTDLFGRGDSYDILKQKNMVEFMSTSFVRGLTLNDCIVIVDESQNMSHMELHSIMTRLGDNSKIIFCGDLRQDDLSSDRFKEYSGLRDFMNILHQMNEFHTIDFGIDDIVRSGLVKSYIIKRYNLGY